MRLIVTATALSASIILASCGKEEPAAAALPSPVALDPVVDLGKLAGQSQDVVKALLGDPGECEASKYGPKCTYSKGETEVVFINGAADWITVNALPGVTYGPEALRAVGLKPVSAAVSNDQVVRYTNVPGFLDVSIFPQGGTVWYVYAKVKTP